MKIKTIIKNYLKFKIYQIIKDKTTPNNILNKIKKNFKLEKINIYIKLIYYLYNLFFKSYKDVAEYI